MKKILATSILLTLFVSQMSGCASYGHKAENTTTAAKSTTEACGCGSTEGCKGACGTEAKQAGCTDCKHEANNTTTKKKK